MEFVRGPSWLPLRLSLYLQIACILAILLAESVWCIVVAAAYLIDPDVGATRVVAYSLVGLIIPFGMLASILALPVAKHGRHLSRPVRLLLEVLPWLAISHWVMSRLPMVYHRGPADMVPGRFNWLWLSITLLAAIVGPITAEQWIVARARAKKISAEALAKIAEIQAQAAERTAERQKQLALQAEKRRLFDESQEAWKDARDAFAAAREKLDDLRTSARCTPDWPRFLKIEQAYVGVLKANPASSTDGYRNRAKAIREFIRDTEWQRPNEFSSDSDDPVPGHVSGAPGD